MPTSIILTITALAVLIGLNVASGILALLQDPTLIVRVLISIGLSALILWGMIVGQRLAWQWGRILGIVAAVLVSIGALLAFVTAARDRASALAAMVVGSILLLQAICLYTIFFALGRPSAMEHFKLRCPSCGKFTYKAANFFFTRAKCKYCNITW